MQSHINVHGKKPSNTHLFSRVHTLPCSSHKDTHLHMHTESRAHTHTTIVTHSHPQAHACTYVDMNAVTHAIVSSRVCPKSRIESHTHNHSSPPCVTRTSHVCLHAHTCSHARPHSHSFIRDSNSVIVSLGPLRGTESGCPCPIWQKQLGGHHQGPFSDDMARFPWREPPPRLGITSSEGRTCDFFCSRQGKSQSPDTPTSSPAAHAPPTEAPGL